MDKATTAFTVLLIAVAGAAVPSGRSRECIRLGESLAATVARTPLVFVADVLSLEHLPDGIEYRVRFRVLEPFKGIEKGEQVVQFWPTVEDFTFVEAQRVLVFAHQRSKDGALRYSTQCLELAS